MFVVWRVTCTTSSCYIYIYIIYIAVGTLEILKRKIPKFSDGGSGRICWLKLGLGRGSLQTSHPETIVVSVLFFEGIIPPHPRERTKSPEAGAAATGSRCEHFWGLE